MSDDSTQIDETFTAIVASENWGVAIRTLDQLLSTPGGYQLESAVAEGTIWCDWCTAYRSAVMPATRTYGRLALCSEHGEAWAEHQRDKGES